MIRKATLPRIAGAIWIAGLTLALAPIRAPVEDWYVITIAGSPAGSVRNLATEEGAEHVETQSFQLVLNRMGSLTEMASETTTRENRDGELLAVDMELDMSSQVTTLRAVVEPGRILIADGAGEASFGREITYEGRLVGPEGVRGLIRENLHAAGDRLRYKSFRPEIGMIAEMNLEVVGREDDLLKVEETLTGIALQTTHWLDSQGKIVKSSIPSPFGVMETVLSDAASASMATAGNKLPEESYGATLAMTQVRLPEPRRSRRVVLELRHRNPDLGWPELGSPGQTVLEQDPDRLLLEVARLGPGEPAAFPVEPTAALAPYLEANAYIQSDDEGVHGLARKIVGETSDVFTAAVALERWVAENMTFDMGVVMAPSVEVLENRKGTCTEYAVLLTTLARALGIPSRFVMGYVYVGGIYGGHAWTEVLIGDRWVGFDGAVPTEGPVDAARLAFLWSSLANGIGELNIGPGLQMYGQIDLSVLEYDLEDGPRLEFASTENGIEIVDGQYRNSSLAVIWSKPEGYSFGEMDLVWPDTGLVTLEGPEGSRATLSVRDRRYWLDDEKAVSLALKRSVPKGKKGKLEIQGREAWLVEAKGRAALGLIRGSELWLLEVESEDAGNQLRKLAEGLEL